MATLDIQAHLNHILTAAPEDQLELFQRVAAMAWNDGLAKGVEQQETDETPVNPYSLT